MYRRGQVIMSLVPSVNFFIFILPVQVPKFDCFGTKQYGHLAPPIYRYRNGRIRYGFAWASSRSSQCTQCWSWDPCSRLAALCQRCRTGIHQTIIQICQTANFLGQPSRRHSPPGSRKHSSRQDHAHEPSTSNHCDNGTWPDWRARLR